MLHWVLPEFIAFLSLTKCQSVKDQPSNNWKVDLLVEGGCSIYRLYHLSKCVCMPYTWYSWQRMTCVFNIWYQTTGFNVSFEHTKEVDGQTKIGVLSMHTCACIISSFPSTAFCHGSKLVPALYNTVLGK